MAELGRKSKSKRRHEKDPEAGGESRGEEGKELAAGPGRPRPTRGWRQGKGAWRNCFWRHVQCLCPSQLIITSPILFWGPSSSFSADAVSEFLVAPGRC